MAGQNICRHEVRTETYTERVGVKESQRHCVAAEEERQQNLASKPQPCGDTQINRNGSVCDIRATFSLLFVTKLIV